MTSSKTSSILGRLLFGLIVIAAIAGAWWKLTQPKPIKVVFAGIDVGKVESSIANTRAGEVESCRRTKLATLMGGRIEQLPVKEGERVKKGQLLMKLWNDDQLAQKNLANAQVDTARQGVAEACSLAAASEREAQRLDLLHAQNYVSSSRSESAQAEADARRAACDSAKARVAQALAQVNVVKVEQGRTFLYAPFDGTVAKITGEIGEYSTPSPPGIPTPPAIDLIDESCLYIKAPMDEVDSTKIHEGQPVRISLDALPKKSFPGHIKRVAPYVLAIEKQSRTVDVEAVFDNPEEVARLLVGYTANIEVILDVRNKVVRVPTSALLEGGRVLVAGVGGKLEERAIKTGLSNWEYTEVLEGLAAGDRVVTSLEREGVKAGAYFEAEEPALIATQR
ncbi:RND family efflux transporter MFP subunit [Sterolibacterium denitrificans]|uniref:RND family efflux transporter MFP subunit n=1 Tax=Sterolibacterium denitrificans TaxID=157592 RepID=A0A7Z7HT70_9PROT|nr:efflux RND transporter periplasmic adaptor subunit [Sterolibacterium denitrificans]SMB32155.1 RND family efflux transporter MFP subunit [Sterolibacterium denitrificans]